jgi:pilus assembly protein CpaE
VHSAKGGLGTTSLALNTAYALARHTPSARVALADLVVSGGDVRVMLDLKATYDVGDLLARMTRIDAELLTSILTPAGQGVWVLAASERPEVAELVDASASSTIVAQLASHYTYTVLDIEHNLTERTLAALDVVDRVLVVTQLGVVPLRSAQRSLELFQRLGTPRTSSWWWSTATSRTTSSRTPTPKRCSAGRSSTRSRTTRAPPRWRSRRPPR